MVETVRPLFQVIVQIKLKDCTALFQTGRPTGWSLLLYIIILYTEVLCTS